MKELIKHPDVYQRYRKYVSEDVGSRRAAFKTGLTLMLLAITRPYPKLHIRGFVSGRKHRVKFARMRQIVERRREERLIIEMLSRHYTIDPSFLIKKGIKPYASDSPFQPCQSGN